MRTIALFLVGSMIAACMASAPKTVSSVDLDKYYGNWYQLADYPQFYEAFGCKLCTTAQYSPNSDGTIAVLNKAFYSVGGRSCITKGSARAPNAAEPAKLKVKFFNLFEADYWIVELGPVNDDGLYSYALVSNANKSSLYILS